MFSRFGVALSVCIFIASTASAQVVRFQTTVGDFDMVLNPTNNFLLEPHVENMLEYIESNRYRASWINRADEGFVLQMGGFYSHTRRPPTTIDSIRPVSSFDPVLGEPGISGLSNTVGTVSLALPGDALGNTDRNGGTSSFFINLGDNSGLDANFTVFAAIPDMTVVNQIMALAQVDRTTDPFFGGGTENLAFEDVPVETNGFQVFITRAFVVQDAMTIDRARALVAPIMAASAESLVDAAGTAALASTIVPEPTSCALLLAGLFGFSLRRPRRR
ncbi:MAG: peptidylprolyl isomerase [Pirellulales bacterium]